MEAIIQLLLNTRSPTFRSDFAREYDLLTSDLPDNFSADQLIPFLAKKYRETIDLRNEENLAFTIRCTQIINRLIDAQYSRKSVSEFTFELTTLYTAMAAAMSYQLIEINLHKLNTLGIPNKLVEPVSAYCEETRNLLNAAIKHNKLDNLNFLFKSTEATIAFLAKPNNKSNQKALCKVIHQAERQQWVTYVKMLSYLFAATLFHVIGNKNQVRLMERKHQLHEETFFARKKMLVKQKAVRRESVIARPR
jgi:hypothetical protein